MESDIVPDVIAERTLTVEEENGNSRKICVRLGKPQPSSSEPSEYYCPLQIAGLGDERVDKIFGVDAFQALHLSLRYIALRLNGYRKKSKCAIYWWDKGDDMGFPEPPAD